MNTNEKEIIKIALSYINYDDKLDFVNELLTSKTDTKILDEMQQELKKYNNDENMETYKIVEIFKSLLDKRGV